MSMYNLLEYNKNYSKTTGSLWNYYKDEHNNLPPNNYNADSITDSVSFKYKTIITGKTPNANLENGANNVLINGKSFFDMPIKNEAYQQIIEMGRNNDYTTDNLLDYEYFSKH